MAEFIMLQGTSSHVGKSILATALCRIFLQEGKKVVPFKAQNMALNSYVTQDGREMGRAQVAQAEAAGLAPQVDMNPVLLKPTGNCCSQVIINGYAVGNMSAKAYHTGYSLKAFSAVKDALHRLESNYDTIVIEGAGSPAEINLKAHDIVNMRVAKYAQAPVLLIADIDRGGSLAALVGTLELLDDEERDLVKGLIINKFRGDVSLFTPAVKFLEEKTGKPVLGIIPYIEQLGIDDEDSVSLDDKRKTSSNEAVIRIGVIQLPKISNFTDFDSLAAEDDVSVTYVQEQDDMTAYDLLILPGSKNTIDDMHWLHHCGMAQKIQQALRQEIPVIGICGGYQMLGQWIHDPSHTESAQADIQGLGLLPIETVFSSQKMTSQVEGRCHDLWFMNQQISCPTLEGYEIHMGRTMDTEATISHPIQLTARAGKPCQTIHGSARADGLVWGTYMHGIFDNDSFRRAIINALRINKRLQPLPVSRNYRAEKQKNYDRLAHIVRQHMHMDVLRTIMKERTKP